MPTALERAGDFSRSVNALGQPIAIVDPQTGLPFPGNRTPRERISPPAAALLSYYPLPRMDGAGRFNYQVPLASESQQHSFQSRFTQVVQRNQLQGSVNYERGDADSTTLFGWPNARENSGIDAQANWSYRLTQFLNMRARYQFRRRTNTTRPHFGQLHERVWRGGDHRQQPGSAQLGAAEPGVRQ